MATFTLDSSVLAGVALTYVETPLQERGRSIQIEWVQSNGDIRIIGHGLRVVPAEDQAKVPSA